MGKFDEVDLGQRPVVDQMRRYRVQMAEQLEAITEEWKLPPETTVAELIERLKQ